MLNFLCEAETAYWGDLRTVHISGTGPLDDADWRQHSYRTAVLMGEMRTLQYRFVAFVAGVFDLFYYYFVFYVLG